MSRSDWEISQYDAAETAREERLDAIRASAVVCEQCGKACYTPQGYRQIERNRGKENWMNLCWDCIDEIVQEAFQ